MSQRKEQDRLVSYQGKGQGLREERQPGESQQGSHIQIEQQKHRHDVRPGLTGLAQVKGRNGISFEERFELDLVYIQNLSLKRDSLIVLKTIRTILKREGIRSETSETMEYFTGTPEEKETVNV